MFGSSTPLSFSPPLALFRLGRDSHGIQEIRDALQAHPLSAELPNHRDGLLLALAGHDLAVLPAFTVGQICLAQLKSIIFELLGLVLATALGRSSPRRFRVVTTNVFEHPRCAAICEVER